MKIDDELETVELTAPHDAQTKPAGDEQKERKKAKHRNEFLVNSLYLLLVFALTLFIVKFVAQRTVVVGSSMEPTLQNADNLIVNKFLYRFSEPKRYDVVVFPYKYEKKTYYIKRIIGLPGETVRIDALGNIYINEVLLDDDIYGAEVINDPGMALMGVQLGEDEYFVMGDNRNHSSDSRSPSVGKINKKDIIGKAVFRIFPFKKWGSVK